MHYIGGRLQTKLTLMKLALASLAAIGFVVLASAGRRRLRHRLPVDGPWFV